MLFIFDMGGVVTSTFKMDSIYEKLNISKETFFELCKYGDTNIWQELETGKILTIDFWNKFNSTIGNLQRSLLDGTYKLNTDINVHNIPNVTNDLFRLYFHPQLNTKTVELIKALRKKHRVVCGTNTIQSHWENHLERGDYSYFDQTYASNKIGAAKPDKYFFELIMEAEGYSPAETFFTDDKIENCNSAKSLGINTFLCTTPEDLYNEWIKYAD